MGVELLGSSTPYHDALVRHDDEKNHGDGFDTGVVASALTCSLQIQVSKGVSNYHGRRAAIEAKKYYPNIA